MASAASQKKLIARLLLLAVLFAVVWFVRNRQSAAPPNSSGTGSPANTSGQQDTRPQNSAPKYVLDVLNYVRRNGESPDGYVGGREFQNREKKLPAKSSDNKNIRYSEWDVQRKVQGQNRGSERLITGSDHSAWYTKDHYKTFQKIE